MKKLYIYLFLMVFMLLNSVKAQNKIVGTWLPNDIDRIQIREEFTFTDSIFYWKTGAFPNKSVWKYWYTDQRLIIQNKHNKQLFYVKINADTLYLNNRTYTLKK